MKRAKIHRDNNAFPDTNSFIRPLASDKPFDGLNPHGVFLDEQHAMKEHHRPFYDTMRTGSGARPQPLICTITTAGDEKSLIWREETQYIKQVLDGSVQDESVFGFIASLDEDDDPFDERNWIKSNPNLGVSVNEDYLREMSKEAQSDAVALNRFKRYHCNVMVSATEQAIDIETWDSAEAELSNWHDADAIAAGFDLGGRDDLCSFALCARFILDSSGEIPIYRYEIRQQSYIASDTTRDLTQEPFARFVSNGRLRVSRHAIQQLRDDLLEECESLGIEYIAHDPYQAMQLALELEEQGLKPVRMPQNYVQFDQQIRDFLSCLSDGRIKHDGDPLLKWCANNAVIVKDRADRWMFHKSTSKDKIDPLVASVMAFRAVNSAPSTYTGKAFFA